MTDRVSVVGLGKLGLGLALSFARAGVRTVGVDVRPDHVADLQRGVCPIVEPGCQAALAEAGARFLATLSVEDAIHETDVTFILAGTPQDPDGRLSTRQVEQAARDVGRALRQSRKAEHLVVVSSTVPPGTTEARIIPAIEEASGRRLNRGFTVCYNPDFVALGSVLRDFAHPDLVVIGESAPEAGQRVAALQARLAASRPSICRMSIVNAELTKVSLNAFLAMKIAFANTVANLCEAVPGADVDQVTRAIGNDRRVGPLGLVGGPPFGGSCLTRDTDAFRDACERFGEDSALVSAVAMSNEWQHARLAGTALALAPKGSRVAILGMAFKAGTPVMDGSAGARLAQSLLAAGREVITFDRLVPAGSQQAVGGAVQVAETPEEALAGAGVVVLTLADPESIRAIGCWRPQAPGTVLDCWRALDGVALDGLVTPVALGRGVRPPESATFAVIAA